MQGDFYFIKNEFFIKTADKIKEKTDVYLRLRSSQVPCEATLEPLGNSEVKLVFHTPQKAVAKGQSAVFYDENGFVLGGGIIKSA